MSPRRWRHVAACIILAASLCAWLQATSLANDERDAPPSPTRSTRAPKDDTGARGIEAKLADVRDNQQEILRRLGEVLKEIGYAKTRAILR